MKTLQRRRSVLLASLLAALLGASMAQARLPAVIGLTDDGTITWIYPTNNVIEYHVRWTTNLLTSPNGWTELPAPIAPTATVLSAQAPAPGPGYFYRVNAILSALPAHSPLDGMVLVLPGPFAMGTITADTTTVDPAERPVHTVSTAAFYMDAHEVTWQQWQDIAIPAVQSGYGFDRFATGKAEDHPVQSVSWYDCVKWCNARSEAEGLTPCYYTSSSFTPDSVYKTGIVNIANEWVKWDANGYRLPTEAEWEKAARGGRPASRFPWGDTISHSQANYYSNTNLYYYDVSPTQEWHPAFNDGVEPYTCPAGYFPANGYGLTEMAGNVWEWCWDWKGDYSKDPQIDPQGPSSGTERVIRGGNWKEDPIYCRVACRGQLDPASNEDNTNIGFRTIISAEH